MKWSISRKWINFGIVAVFIIAAFLVGQQTNSIIPKQELPTNPQSKGFSPTTDNRPLSRQTRVDVSQQPAPVQETAEAMVSNTSQVSSADEYTIQPEDVLQITVYEEPDLSTKVRVTTSEEINFPLLGRLQVVGLSIMALQEKLTKLLAEDYLINPQVQVFIESYHSRDVFVTGSVNKPGSYPLPAGKPTTLMEAIAMAGGFHERAAVNNTRIIRIENSKEKTIVVRAKDIIQKGDKSKDVEVHANDVIFVPESFF